LAVAYGKIEPVLIWRKGKLRPLRLLRCVTYGFLTYSLRKSVRNVTYVTVRYVCYVCYVILTCLTLRKLRTLRALHISCGYFT